MISREAATTKSIIVEIMALDLMVTLNVRGRSWCEIAPPVPQITPRCCRLVFSASLHG